MRFKKTNILIISGGIVAILILFIVSRAINSNDRSPARNTDQTTITKANPVVIGEGDSGLILPSETTEDTRKYTHQILDFSFEYPKQYNVGGFTEGESGEIVLVQRSDRAGESSISNNKDGFQIFINLIDESIELTPQRIQQDLPGTLVNNAQKILLDNKADGIIFESNSSSFGGASQEIWFIYNGYLYQVSSYLEFSDQLKNIIGTWKFI